MKRRIGKFKHNCNLYTVTQEGQYLYVVGGENQGLDRAVIPLQLEQYNPALLRKHLTCIPLLRKSLELYKKSC